MSKYFLYTYKAKLKNELTPSRSGVNSFSVSLYIFDITPCESCLFSKNESLILMQLVLINFFIQKYTYIYIFIIYIYIYIYIYMYIYVYIYIYNIYIYIL